MYAICENQSQPGDDHSAFLRIRCIGRDTALGHAPNSFTHFARRIEEAAVISSPQPSLSM